MGALTCSKETCPIASGGRCLEGFTNPRAECPNISEGARDAQAVYPSANLRDSDAAEGTSSANDLVAIRSAADLSEDEAEQLCRQTHCQVITVAGLEESGKSALVTCPFHIFLGEPFAGFAFAGARTLAGFDERCHRARVDSGREAATIARTFPETGRRYLHLRVAAASEEQSDESPTLRKPVDLLLTDISGEDFRHARDNVEEAKALSILRRTDRLAILFDGALLRDPHTRQGAARDSLALFRSIVDAGMIDTRTAVDLVVTKWDLLDDLDSKGEFTAFLEQVKGRANRLAGRVAELRWHRVAALPTRQSVPFGLGVDALFQSWVTSSYQMPAREVVDPIPIPNATEYARVGYRHLAEIETIERAR